MPRCDPADQAICEAIIAHVRLSGHVVEFVQDSHRNPRGILADLCAKFWINYDRNRLRVYRWLRRTFPKEVKKKRKGAISAVRSYNVGLHEAAISKDTVESADHLTSNDGHRLRQRIPNSLEIEASHEIEIVLLNREWAYWCGGSCLKPGWSLWIARRVKELTGVPCSLLITSSHFNVSDSKELVANAICTHAGCGTFTIVKDRGSDRVVVTMPRLREHHDEQHQA